MIDFPRKLYLLRCMHGFTQRALAEEVGVSTVAINSWEGGRGVPRLDTLYALAKVLGVLPGDLLPNAGDSEKRSVQGLSFSESLLEAFDNAIEELVRIRNAATATLSSDDASGIKQSRMLTVKKRRSTPPKPRGKRKRKK